MVGLMTTTSCTAPVSEDKNFSLSDKLSLTTKTILYPILSLIYDITKTTIVPIRPWHQEKGGPKFPLGIILK